METELKVGKGGAGAHRLEQQLQQWSELQGGGVMKSAQRRTIRQQAAVPA